MDKDIILNLVKTFECSIFGAASAFLRLSLLWKEHFFQGNTSRLGSAGFLSIRTSTASSVRAAIRRSLRKNVDEEDPMNDCEIIWKEVNPKYALTGMNFSDHMLRKVKHGPLLGIWAWHPWRGSSPAHFVVTSPIAASELSVIDLVHIVPFSIGSILEQTESKFGVVVNRNPSDFLLMRRYPTMTTLRGYTCKWG